jgi:hypothetical protein
MKKIKQLLNSIALSKLLTKNKIIILEQSNFKNKNYSNSQIFTKKSAKNVLISKEINVSSLKFPINVITFETFLSFLSAGKKFIDPNLIFTKVGQYLFFKNFYLLKIFNADKTFLSLQNTLSTYIHLLKIFNFKN